ncbi:MAG: hypothetical protein E7627_01635 [Ruminococcaceae bacterium]|nr:hypothetical protein [Oscillospiraceae bacterium]
MPILKKEDFDKKLYAYYIEKYGAKDTDEWFEQPAVNVWCFRRADKIITLKSHILHGEVEAIEEKV